MRWDDVQIFLEIARSGSLSGAARRLGLNHSTIYRRLNSFEEALQVRLFEREGGRYTLTDAGAAALPLAGDVDDAILALRRSVEGHDTTPSGTVRLTAPEALLPLLSPHLAPFRAAYPRIDLQVAFADRFFDLSRREADVALRPILQPEVGAAGRRIAGIAWACYAPASMDAERCDTLPWGVYSEALSQLAAARWHAEHHGEDDVLLSVNSVPAMQAVICAAGCRGLLPCFVGDSDESLRRMGGPVEAAESALWLLTHPDLRSNARVRALLDHLWEALRGEQGLLEGLRG
jgi:molybdate transport repressor ModE-like protein